MPLSQAKKNIIKKWLESSAVDLQSAKLLYKNGLLPVSLYHLQQSNEKLAKALLLSIGFLTAKNATDDARVKAILGFSPKEPASYRHRTMPSLVSDIEKSIPAIEEIFTLIESSDFGLRVPDFQRMLKQSKRDVQKLKKKPTGPVTSKEQLEREVFAIRAVLAAIDNVDEQLQDELKNFDYQGTVSTVRETFEKSGVKTTAEDIPSFESIKERVLLTTRRTILAMISVGIASLLDPLESITRYPDSPNNTFDQNNPYIHHFQDLCDCIDAILEKSLQMFV